METLLTCLIVALVFGIGTFSLCIIAGKADEYNDEIFRQWQDEHSKGWDE